MPDAPRKSRFRRFSLWTLLMLTALVAVVCGYLASVRRQYVFEQEFAQRLRTKSWVESSAVAYVPDWLSWWPGSRKWFERIDTVRVWSPMDADDLRQLGELPELRYLDLAGSGVGDRELGLLPTIETLEHLDLEATKVTDAVLIH
jgi:hypothetical protein